MADNPGNPYRDVYAQKDLDQLKRWVARASELGMAEEFLAALRAIHERLTTEPLRWGDPLFRLRNLGLIVHRGIHARIEVHYAVDEQRKLVHVRELKLLQGHPLEEQP